MQIEKPTSQFGLLSDAKIVMDRAVRNIRLATTNVYNLRMLAEAGDALPPADVARILKETEDALRAVVE
jgi:hypothetical protein